MTTVDRRRFSCSNLSPNLATQSTKEKISREAKFDNYPSTLVLVSTT